MKWLGQSRNDFRLWIGQVVKVKAGLVKFCKKQYFIGTWNIRFMNRGKLDVVKPEMTRLNIDILGIYKLKWMGMGEFR